MTIREPICAVWIGNKELSISTLRLVSEIQIVLPEHKAKSGHLVLRDVDHALFDSNMFHKGQKLAILVGLVNEMEPYGPFVVKSYKSSAGQDGMPRLTVKFQDHSHKMNKKQKKKRHTGSPVSILKKIAKEHGLGYEIDSIEGLTFTDEFPLIQANLTDAALIHRLAERYGYVWGIDGGTLYFRRPDDLEERQQQVDVPILSYRINDWSLQSFDAEIKFTGNRKRKGAKSKTSNVDFLKNVKGKLGLAPGEDPAFNTDVGRDILSEFSPKLGKIVDAALGQDTDDDEPDKPGVSTDAQTRGSKQGVERVQGQEVQEEDDNYSVLAINIGEGRVRQINRRRWKGSTLYPEPNTSSSYNPPDTGDQAIQFPTLEDQNMTLNEETEPGDATGAATPDNEEEAKRRNAANVLRSSEIINASIVPTLASTRYAPGGALVLAGIGERFSGKYKIKEVTIRISEGGGTFQTSMKVQKRAFRPDSKSKTKISQASESDENWKPGAAGSALGKPEKIASNKTQTKQSVSIDIAKGTGRIITRVVDGKTDG